MLNQPRETIGVQHAGTSAPKSDDEGSRLVSGVQTSRLIRGEDLVFYLEHLEALPLQALDRVRAVFYRVKGVNCHAEVACRIKGIPLIAVQDVSHEQGAFTIVRVPRRRVPVDAVRAYGSGVISFQATIYESADLRGVDLDRLETVFLRQEHVVYRAYEEAEAKDRVANRAESLLRTELRHLDAMLPPGVTIVVRALDARSDDAILGPLLHGTPERNPEMGAHGARHLAADPRWCEAIARCFRGFAADRVAVACPFVTTHREFDSFVHAYRALFAAEQMVPFVESPAFFGDVNRYLDSSRVCVGYKDLAQFYFAADRNSEFAKQVIDYVDGGLMQQLRQAISHLTDAGVSTSIYQSIETLALFADAFEGLQWVPSMSAHELSLLAAAQEG